MIAAHRVLKLDEPDPTSAGLCALTIMTKAPRAGNVKTRLVPPLTPEEAAALNICFLRDTAAAISKVRAGARGIGCYTPLGSESVYREIFPANFQLIPQRGHSFGERLILATEDLLKIGFHSVCLIDSDSPTVPPTIFAEAIKVLAAPNDKVVLGPSEDGGYYLIGLQNAHRRMFEEVEWSTERVFAQTMERAVDLGLEVHLLPAWYDVDDHATLNRLCEELLSPNESAVESAAPATCEMLRRILAKLPSR